jgi:GAF domain-containing protein
VPEAQTIHDLCGQLDRGEIDHHQFLERFAREMAALIDTSRAGVWMFADSPEGKVLHCVALYDRGRDVMLRAPDLYQVDVGVYIDELLREGFILAPDARTHPATAICNASYLIPNDIHSVLEVGFSVNGVVCGTFSCEQTGGRQEWTQRQLQLLRHIGSRASLALMNAAAAQIDTAPGALWEPSSPNRLTMSAPLEPKDP